MCGLDSIARLLGIKNTCKLSIDYSKDNAWPFADIEKDILMFFIRRINV